MEERNLRKTRVGKVVSNKMDKTIVVKVERMAKHALYGKPVLSSKKFLVQDSENACREGDVVLIGETRPLSRHKRWELLEIVEKAKILGSDEEATR